MTKISKSYSKTTPCKLMPMGQFWRAHKTPKFDPRTIWINGVWTVVMHMRARAFFADKSAVFFHDSNSFETQIGRDFDLFSGSIIENTRSITILWERRSSPRKNWRPITSRNWRIQIWNWESTSFVFFHDMDIFFVNLLEIYLLIY